MKSVIENQLIDELNDVSLLALGGLRAYFSTTNAPKEDAKRADQAIAMLGRMNSAKSSRVKERMLFLQAAKIIGVQGEELRPLLTEIAPEAYASVAARAKKPEALAEPQPKESAGPAGAAGGTEPTPAVVEGAPLANS